MEANDPRRLDLARYPLARTILGWHADWMGDGAGNDYLINSRVSAYYEEAQAAFRDVAFKDVPKPQMLATQVTMRRLGEPFFPGTLDVGSAISRISDTSIELAQGLFCDEECIGLCDTVLVNKVEGRLTPFFDDARACLSRFALLVDAAGAG